MDCGTGWLADAFCIGVRPPSGGSSSGTSERDKRMAPARESSVEQALMTGPLLGGSGEALLGGLLGAAAGTAAGSSAEVAFKLRMRIDELEERIRLRRRDLVQLQQLSGEQGYDALMERGKEAFRLANFMEAGNVFDLARKAAGNSNNAMQAARASANLGNVCYALLKYRAALRHYETAITLFRSINEPGFEGAVLDNAVETCIKLQRFELALGYATRKTGLEMASHGGGPPTLSKARWLLDQIASHPDASDDLLL